MRATSAMPLPGRRPRLRFGDFTLDLDSGFLLHGVEEVKLRPKSFEVLAYLVENRGKLVTKNELVRAVWANVVVTDNSLAQCLVDIRRGLADEQQRIIRTVARRGYVFSAPVTALPAAGERSREAGAPAAGRSAARGLALAGIAAVALLAAWAVQRATSGPPRIEYTQLTDFADSAVAPALSPDGRMLVFIRGRSSFFSPDQIWAKLLPNGEPVQLTQSPLMKFQPFFSPDGTQVAYGVVDQNGWNTQAVSPLGGPPRLLLAGSTGLSWLDDARFLYSTQRHGRMQMGVVTASAGGGDVRDVYWPAHERAMAHFSYPSPDRRFALVVEMDQQPVWLPCRLVPLDGGGPEHQAGPRGGCTSAGWSPDGRWMYFGVDVNGDNQLWRQRFPNGEPEQLTFGPTEASGIAVDPDGRSLITSIGLARSELLLRDAHGERALLTEGAVASIGWGLAAMSSAGWSSAPSFSADGRYLYCVSRRQSGDGGFRLLRTEISTGATEELVPQFSIFEYDVSPDGREVAFSTGPDTERMEIWVAPVDRSAAPRKLAEGGVGSPQFGSRGDVLFRKSERSVNYLYRKSLDGSGEERAVPYPINTVQGSSPDGRYVAALLEQGGSFVLPMNGGDAVQVCRGSCEVRWSPDGSRLHIAVEWPSRESAGASLAIPLGSDGTLPAFPPGGVASLEHGKKWFPEAFAIDRGEAVPGIEPGTYAYVRTEMHRNLFRISLR